MTQDLYNMKRSLELEWHQEHLKEGRYNINMGYIDKKIQGIIKEIIAQEEEAAFRENRVNDSEAQVSIAT